MDSGDERPVESKLSKTGKSKKKINLPPSDSSPTSKYGTRGGADDNSSPEESPKERKRSKKKRAPR